jgi:putative membrane protein
MKSTLFVLCSSAVLWALPVASVPSSAATASAADKVFAAKVSQGGMYEVVASKVAQQKATTQDVRDLAIMEVHDHDLVNRELREIATATGINLPQPLNDTFRQRLQKLEDLSGPAFDEAYISDMAQIHDMDEKLFAKEAVEGSEKFKVFAAGTDKIVKRHIGAIHGTDGKEVSGISNNPKVYSLL